MFCALLVRVCARKYFSFATSFANLIYFVPFSKSFGHILAIFFAKKNVKDNILFLQSQNSQVICLL